MYIANKDLLSAFFRLFYLCKITRKQCNNIKGLINIHKDDTEYFQCGYTKYLYSGTNNLNRIKKTDKEFVNLKIRPFL